ncbi:hypothetical protein Dimus_010436 [Dionaea muscipula]
MIEHGLKNVMEVIKRQNGFKRRELVHVDAVKEIYAKLTMSHNRKKDVARSKVRGVEIVFDHLQLVSILGIPGNNGICEYIKEVREESKYTKPLEITRRFANDETIMEERRVKSVELKPFQRRLVNLPRVMMRHMSYVISVKDHELPYGNWLTMVFEEFGVPLVDKKGEEPTILRRHFSQCLSDEENGIWWIGTGENRRRNDEMETPAEEVHQEEEVQKDFDWEAVIDEALVQGESGSGEKFYDAEDKVNEEVPAITAPS